MKNLLAAIKIEIKGTVQGVGFRPFVYRIAKKYCIKGDVSNNSQGVVIRALADSKTLKSFIRELRASPPPLAVIRQFTVTKLIPFDCITFKIAESQDSRNHEIDITPDIGICPQCQKELHDPLNHRYHYPFINCTECGPRFSIIQSLPYDRPFTTMKDFTLCPVCADEYQDPTSRRFHAQPVSCPQCGPVLQLVDSQGHPVKTMDPIFKTCELLQEGHILAIKGLGGFHLVCRADLEKTVAALRCRKIRDQKPFALMIPDVSTAREIAFVSVWEEQLLSGIQKPIVLVKKRLSNYSVKPWLITYKNDNSTGEYNQQYPLLCPLVAPGISTYALMLPYTPLHQLLFTVGHFKALIMTSANTSDEPMVYKNEQALQDLKQIADFFLLHNRDIQTRVDDSIVKIIAEKPVFLRRARGYVPEPLPAPVSIEGIVACGGVLKSTITIGRGQNGYISTYLGKMENLETLQSLQETVRHMLHLLKVKPIAYACDLHPGSLSAHFARQMAESGNKPLEYIQHHHAHAAACMAENGLTQSDEAICVIYDGSGYGTDDTVWGGEIFLSSYRQFERLAHLASVPMPGGELAIKYPWRMAWGFLYHQLQDKLDEYFPQIAFNEKEAVSCLLQTSTSCPLTSSVGRLFDAMAALAGVCLERQYEGQPAILLEELADADEQDYYEWHVDKDEQGLLRWDGTVLLTAALQELLRGVHIGIISARFHNSVAGATAALIRELVLVTGHKKICLSGGCFQNALLTTKTVNLLKSSGLQVFTHRLISPNDEGISYGQAVITGSRRNM